MCYSVCLSLLYKDDQSKDPAFKELLVQRACMLSCFRCVQLFATPWIAACRLLCLWDSPGKNIGVGCHFLLQGIFMTQGLNRGLLHWWVASLPFEAPGKQRKKKLLSVEESVKALLRKAFKLSLEKESRFINIEMDWDIPGLQDFQSKDGHQGVRGA